MRKIIYNVLVVFFLGMSISHAQYQEKDVDRYIDRFKDLALAEQNKHGIPAAIKLAQGIYETGAGTSELANNAFNHFGIKCKSNWTGDTYTYDDDMKNECFRKYPTHEESYLDHSQFLLKNKRYAPLFELSPLDYKGWAHQLKKSGYATNPQYASKLIYIIEKYDLNYFTELAMANPNFIKPQNEDVKEEDDIQLGYTVAAPVNTNVVSAVPTSQGEEKFVSKSISDKEFYKEMMFNGMRGFYARKGDMLLNQAIKYKIRYANLLSYNDLKDEPLDYDMFIYLEQKKKLGNVKQVLVKEGDNLHVISQQQGIQLEALRKLNRLSLGEEPAAGELLNLQSAIESKPKLRLNEIEGVIVKNSSDYDYAELIKKDAISDYYSEEELPEDDGTQEESEEVIIIVENEEEEEETEEDEVSTAIVKHENVQKNFREIENQAVVVANDEINRIEALKQKMDRSVYSDQDAVPNKTATIAKSNPIIEEVEAVGATNYNNVVPKSNSDINRAPKNNVIKSSKAKPIKSSKEINESLLTHMKNVKSKKFPNYVPKATGVAHTQAYVPPAPKKVAVKAAPKKSNKTTAKKTTTNNTNTKKTASTKTKASSKKVASKSTTTANKPTAKTTAKKQTKAPAKKAVAKTPAKKPATKPKKK